MATLVAMVRSRPVGSRTQEIDRYVGTRMRERRIMLGFTQQHMAELIGVSCQQTCKYEGGINRITAGRLGRIAEALDVNIEYFFDGLEGEGSSEPTQQQNFLELAHSFIAVPDRKHREAICDLARAMVNPMLQADAS